MSVTDGICGACHTWHGPAQPHASPTPPPATPTVDEYMQAAIAQAQRLLPGGHVLNAAWIYGPAPQPPVQPAPVTTIGFLGTASPAISPDGSQINTLDSLDGSLYNAYGKWEFGPGITPPTGAHPPGPFGAFHYVKLNGKVINRIGQFGVANRTGVSQIIVDYGGNVFFLIAENDRLWYQFFNYDVLNNGAGSPLIDPTQVAHLPLPNYMPPYTPSPDGAMITSAPGSVTTSDGVWSNGAGGATWQLSLNGVFAAFADPTSQFSALTVACHGNVFVKDWVTGNWAALLSGNKYDCGSASIPPGPIPIDVAVTPSPALVSGSVPGPQVPASTPIGTVVATVAVTMSDGSPFAGTLSLNTGASWLGIAPGTTTIVTTGQPASSGAYFTEARAAQGGIGPISPGASTIEIIVP